MSRALVILLLVLLLVLSGFGLMFYLAYGVSTSMPARAAVPGLDGETRIAWYDHGLAVIEAGSERDAHAALGYVHGFQHTWNVLLWRQAAAGRLAEWFGDDLLPIDELVHRLALPEMARQSYARLSDEERALLEAYAAGLNAALSNDAVTANAFVLHRERPEPWEPWQSLAVERLFAWLATTPPDPDTLAFAGADAVDFFSADRRLRRWLHVHGFENSTAWAVSDSLGTHFLQRHVYGATALPFFQEVSLTWPDGPHLTGATLPGTPYFPAGRSESRAWALLLFSPADLVRVVADTNSVQQVYGRIQTADGNEHLIVSRRDVSAIYFDPPPRPPARLRPDTALAAPDAGVRLDSTWALRWRGLQVGTDWPAWRALVQGAAEPFRLFSGSGLSMTPGGTTEVLGAPGLVHRFPGGVLVANSPWTAYAAAYLDSLARQPGALFLEQPYSEATFSPWAARLAPRMIEAAGSIPDQPRLVSEALTYLRNWDFRYDRASIAASIFDTWVSLYQDSTGALPRAEVPDTLVYENLFRYQMLVRAVSRLEDAFGPNLSQWRWERVQPRRYFFPTWSEASDGTLPQTRYAPLELPGAGHPSTLYWGPSPVRSDLLAPGHWEAWIETRTWDQIEVQRYRFSTETFFGRYLVMERPPGLVALMPSREATYRTTVLTPPVRAEDR